MGMFGKWPFRSKARQADIALGKMPQAIEIASEKWIEFEAQEFAKPMELGQRILAFTDGLEAGLRKWDAFKSAPDGFFLLIAAKGIEHSRAHLRMDIEAALKIPIPEPFERSDEEELSELQDILIDRVARKWTYFEDTIHFDADVSLAHRIDAFKGPFLEGVRRELPSLAKAPDSDFGAFFAIGIERSGRWSILEVHDALGLNFD
jgi:hypothetical protein